MDKRYTDINVLSIKVKPKHESLLAAQTACGERS